MTDLLTDSWVSEESLFPVTFLSSEHTEKHVEQSGIAYQWLKIIHYSKLECKQVPLHNICPVKQNRLKLALP